LDDFFIILMLHFNIITNKKSNHQLWFTIFLTSSYITKPVTTNIVFQFIYLSRIKKTNHINGHGRRLVTIKILYTILYLIYILYFFKWSIKIISISVTDLLTLCWNPHQQYLLPTLLYSTHKKSETYSSILFVAMSM
jgi:hypothetical protein